MAPQKHTKHDLSALAIFMCVAPLFYPVILLDIYIAHEANKFKWIWQDAKTV